MTLFPYFMSLVRCPVARPRPLALVGLSVVLGSMAAAGPALPVRADESLEPRPAFEHTIQPFLARYCVDCHAGEAAEAGVALDKFTDGSLFQQHRPTWQKVIRHLRALEMPPADALQPEPDERSAAVDWLEAELASFDCSGPRNPGWETLQRLNRTEYRNTVRDLLGVDFEPQDSFPRDQLGYGFDNIGDVLSLSPLLLEKYLAAAEEIAAQVIVAPESIDEPLARIRRRRWQGGEDLGRGVQTLLTDGSIEFTHDFEQAGRYLLRATVSAQQAGDEQARMALVSAGRRLKTVDVTAGFDDPETLVVLLEVPAGRHRLGVEFLNDYYRPKAPKSRGRDRNLLVHALGVVGPLGDELLASSEVLPEKPSYDGWQDPRAWRPVVERVLRPLLMRAYRRPPRDEEVARLVELVDGFRQQGDSYQRAMQLALEAILVSPQFLFRGEFAAPGDEEAEYPVSDYELASRLSYFLWSTMPDEALFEQAAAGTLRDNLAPEVERMLDSERVEALIRNFGGQWLGTRSLADVEPDAQQFPEFDDELREAMLTEAELLFGDVVRNDRDIMQLLTGDYKFVNERLAEHYGIEGVRGADFRRVSLGSDRSGGVVTLAAVLTITSHADRTSPVKRGKWILGQLLGNEPPPPPPGVESLPEGEAAEGATLRELLEAHRENATCASCHEVMDELGFALERFDAIGRLRDEDRGHAIDDTGRLPDGQEFRGASGLRDVLVARQDEFRRTLTEKMLTYALGRGLEYYDQCAVADICEQVADGQDRFSRLVLAIVRSDPFQKRRRQSQELNPTE